MTIKLTNRRVFPTLLLTIKSFAQTVYKLEQKLIRSKKLGEKNSYFWNKGEREGRDRGREIRRKIKVHLHPSFKVGSDYKYKNEERDDQFVIFIYLITKIKKKSAPCECARESESLSNLNISTWQEAKNSD
jgi:hypothetical protein